MYGGEEDDDEFQLGPTPQLALTEREERGIEIVIAPTTIHQRNGKRKNKTKKQTKKHGKNNEFKDKNITRLVIGQ